jgi:hypothetical protein
MNQFSWDLFEKFDWEDFLHTQQISPRIFVRCWLGIDSLPAEQIANIEKKRGYRARCVQLISRILGIDSHAVELYGSGLEFEKMPKRNRQKLAIALLARESVQNTRTNSTVKVSW